MPTKQQEIGPEFTARYVRMVRHARDMLSWNDRYVDEVAQQLAELVLKLNGEQTFDCVRCNLTRPEIFLNKIQVGPHDDELVCQHCTEDGENIVGGAR